MYGTGMRVIECERLRILDIEFSYQQIVVRAGILKKVGIYRPFPNLY
jgi:integrase